MNDSVRAQEAAALLQLLDEQAALFEEWLAFDQMKREALLERDRVQLEESVLKQSQLLIELDRIEQKRRQAVKNSFPDVPDTPLRQLSDLVPLHQRGRWLRSEARLRELVGRVQESNIRCEALLRQAAAHNHVVLDALLGQDGVHVTYGPPGVAQGSQNHGADERTKARRINQQA